MAIEGLAKKLSAAGARVEQRLPAGFDIRHAWDIWGEIVITERAATAPDRVEERVAALNASLGPDVPVGRGSARGAAH